MSLPLGKTHLKAHPLLLLLWGVGLLTGHGLGFLAGAAALTLHEGGHFAAARLLGIPITAVEITPFGGVMTPDGFARVSPASRFAYAAAGPAMSLAGCFLAALLYRLDVPFSFVQRFARANLLLLVVNLLPALPLDGGEMLFSLLTIRFSHAAVTRALTGVGYALGALLGFVSLMAAFRGELILFPLFAGLYLVYAASAERRQSTARYLTALIARRQKLENGEAMTVEVLAAGADTPARLLLPRLSLQKYHWILVLSPNGMDCLGQLDEKTFCDLVLSHPEAPVGAFLPKEQQKSDPPQGADRR